MTCKEAESLVMPYIKNELTDEELFEFLEHIEHCPECREELEIYFTVDVGIRQLDSKSIGGNTVRVQVPQPALHPWQGIGLKITYLRYF